MAKALFVYICILVSAVSIIFKVHVCIHVYNTGQKKLHVALALNGRCPIATAITNVNSPFAFPYIRLLRRYEDA